MTTLKTACPNEINGRFRVSTIGHHVAGTDDPLRWDLTPLGFGQDGPGRLQV